MFLLILITFRSIRLTLLALAPTVLGLVWAAALLAWIGVRLDLFSIFAVLTLIGIGVDYGIHLVHRAAAEPGDLDSRSPASRPPTSSRPASPCSGAARSPCRPIRRCDRLAS